MINWVSLSLGRTRKRNLFSHVVEQIGGRVVRGEFSPGAALPNEAELGTEFGASRSVIREAVKALAAKGLLQSQTRTGITVLPSVHWNLLDSEVLEWRFMGMPPAEFFREIFEIRGMIEPQAAELAAVRSTDLDMAEIAAGYAAMKAAQPGQSAIHADIQFHRAILAGAHNGLLLQMGSLIGVGLLVSYRLLSDHFAVSLPLHRAVLDAISARRGRAAGKAMTLLLAEMREFHMSAVSTRETDLAG